jgi:Na+/melibiose symporter-like transporter
MGSDESGLEERIISAFQSIVKRRSLGAVQSFLAAFGGVVLFGIFIIMQLLGNSNGGKVISFVFVMCMAGLLFSLYLAGYILSCDTG